MRKEELLVTAEDKLFPGFSNQCLSINKKVIWIERVSRRGRLREKESETERERQRWPSQLLRAKMFLR